MTDDGLASLREKGEAALRVAEDGRAARRGLEDARRSAALVAVGATDQGAKERAAQLDRRSGELSANIRTAEAAILSSRPPDRARGAAHRPRRALAPGG